MSADDQAIRRRVRFSGRVQGVGFRMTTQQIAQDFAVAGYVRNLPDGDVELEAQGDPQEVERFLNRVRGSFSSNIRDEESADTQPATDASGFEIRH